MSDVSKTNEELLAKVMDALAYYQCRSVNPKADHPFMGYHAMSEDQREFLQERQREAAEEIVRMIPALSRATVPDAATKELLKRVEEAEAQSAEDRVEWQQMKERASQRFNAYQQKKRELRQMEIRAEKAEAERAAALAAIERVRAVLAEERAWHEHMVESGDAVPRTVIGIGKVEAALDGAPEPEVKP